jgi:hypothetical protein
MKEMINIPEKDFPAFPVTGEIRWADPSTELLGMTLRDYFAARAMQSIILDTKSDAGDSPAVLALSAYMMADAMMEARKK